MIPRRCWSTRGSDFGSIGVDDLCESEVADFHEAVFTAGLSFLLHQKDVRGFQIAMKNSFVVSCFDAGNDLPHDRRCSLRTYSAFATQQVIESFTFDVFHHEKEHAVSALAEVGDVNDVGMANRRGGACFTFKTSDGFAFL